MKKLLLSTLLFAAGMLATNASETVFNFPDMGYDNAEIVTTVTEGSITLTFNVGEGQTEPAYYTSGTSMRLYAGNTLEISAASGCTITDIAFELRDYSYATSSNPERDYTVDNGTLSINMEGYEASWTGNSQAVTLSIANTKNDDNKNIQLHIRKLTVTYSNENQTVCDAPSFSLDEGTYYTAQSIALTCPTEGATIVYSVNGGEAQNYAAPIELSETGTYEITAHAEKEGLDNSEEVTATYVIADPIEVGDFEELKMNSGEPEGTLFELTFPVTVTYQAGSYLFVKDPAENAMLIYGNQIPDYEQGDVIPAGIQAEFTQFYGLYEMQYPVASTFGAASDNVEVSPIPMQAADITFDDQNKIIVLRNAEFSMEDERNGTATDASGSINVYVQTSMNITIPENGTYDIIAAASVHETQSASSIQITPLEFREAGSMVESVGTDNDATVNTVAGGIVVNTSEGCLLNVYNAAGQTVEAAVISAGETTVELPTGFYIVKAGETVVKVVVR